jgi:phage protein U
MLAMIGTVYNEFLFEMNDVSYQQLKDVFTFGWSKKNRLNNSPIYMKKGKTEHKLEISGTLILKKVYALDPLIEIADQKIPVTFVTLNFARVYMVTIQSISIDKDIFLDNGSEVRKKFTMQLEEFYGN